MATWDEKPFEDAQGFVDMEKLEFYIEAIVVFQEDYGFNVHVEPKFCTDGKEFTDVSVKRNATKFFVEFLEKYLYMYYTTLRCHFLKQISEIVNYM